MPTVIRTALWLGVVDALAGAALLGFLYTPEANVLMLGVSALLIVVAGVLLLLSSASAAHGLVHGVAPWSSVGAAARHLPLVLVVLMVLGVLCGGAGWFESWWMSRAGEVDAAAIVAGDVTRTGWVHTAVHWIVVLVQWVLVPAWFATALAWIAGYERRDVLTLKWLTAGLRLASPAGHAGRRDAPRVGAVAVRVLAPADPAGVLASRSCSRERSCCSSTCSRRWRGPCPCGRPRAACRRRQVRV